MNFNITPSQLEKLIEWKKNMDDKWPNRHFGKPYYGASGGSLTYSFTPTSLGVVITVKHANGEELDLSEYDNW